MSVEAEQHLLACVIVDQSKVADLLEIPESWFSHNSHKTIYRAVVDLTKQSLDVDVFSVMDYLKSTRQLEFAGGPEYIIEISESLPNVAHWNSYKNVLFNSYKTGKIKSLSENLQMQIGTGSRPEEIVSFLQKSVVELMTDHHKGGLLSISKYMDQALAEIQWRIENPGKMKGHQTGFKELDETIDGFQGGKVHVVAGRTGMGKTAFSLNLALRLARDKPVCVFSLEMTGMGLSMRAICNESRVFNSKFKKGELSEYDMNEIAMAVTRLHENSKLYIDETPGLSVAQMRSRLKAFKIAHGDVGAIVVDHIGLVAKEGRKTDTEAMTEIAHELQRLSKEFDAPLIELVQINRASEHDRDKRPAMSNLKQSGAIEEDARVIMLLYRDEYYNPDTADAGITEVNVAKNSDGETKTIYFRHNLAIGHYEEISGYEPAESERKSNRKF